MQHENIERVPAHFGNFSNRYLLLYGINKQKKKTKKISSVKDEDDHNNNK